MFRARLHSLALGVLTSFVLAASLPAVAQVRYNVTDLGALPGKAVTAAQYLNAINNKGNIAAYCNNGLIAFDWFAQNVACIWSKQGGLQVLPGLPGYNNSSAWVINDHDQVIGMAGDSLTNFRGVLWDKGIAYDLGALPGDNYVEPTGMNNRGQIVGVSQLLLSDEYNPTQWQNVRAVGSSRPFLWENGQMRLLPGGEVGGAGQGINDKGQIVGRLMLNGPAGGLYVREKAVLWNTDGSITELGSLGGDWTSPYNINNAGQISGFGMTATGEQHAFRWKNGVITDLGTRGGPYSGAWGQNSKGQIVGESTDVNGDDHAVLWENGSLYDLNDLIPANSGWVLIFATGINDKGEIVAVGFHNGLGRSCILTPTKYTITDLGVLPNRANTILFGTRQINNAGQVTGYCNNGGVGNDAFFGDYFTDSTPFVWSEETGIQPLPLLPGSHNSLGWALNQAGQIIGQGGDSWTGTRALVWENEILRVLKPLLSDNFSYTLSINSQGDVVGASGVSPDGSSFSRFHPVLWRKGTDKPLLLPTAGATGGGTTGSINEKGVICGNLFTETPGDFNHTIPALWEKGVLTILPTLGGDFCQCTGINNKGQVGGVGQNSFGVTHGFLWENGVMTELPDLGYNGFSAVWDINDRGQMVGQTDIAALTGHATLWEDGVVKDLNDMIPDNSGWVLGWAVGINERGQIVGGGWYNGQTRAYIITPNPPVRAVRGQVALLDSVNLAQTLTFTFRPLAGGSDIVRTQTLTSAGNFTFWDIPSGEYQLSLKGSRWLRRNVAVDIQSEDALTVTAILTPGDANDDNSVDIFDLATLAEAFNTLPGDPLWNENADFDCDESVSLFDLASLAAYFNTSGEP